MILAFDEPPTNPGSLYRGAMRLAIRIVGLGGLGGLGGLAGLAGLAGLVGSTIGLVACGFAPGAAGQPTTDSGTSSDSSQPPLDGTKVTSDTGTDPTCGWTFAHTNFDGCTLAANPTALDITTPTTMLDPSTPSASRTMVTQSDGTKLVVYHLSELSLASSSKLYLLDANDVAGFVFAVDGNVTLAGDLIVAVGANDTTHCATSEGTDGVASTQNSAGGGGGGGGGAGAAGGDGTDGAATGFGAHGARGTAIANASSLSPLRGGCAGGRGAKIQGGSGTGTAGGHGGGAIQIAARGTITITISGEIDAAGRGGGTSTQPGEGGGGGGAGGGVLLEAPAVTISGPVCSDGGSGAQGGGASLAGSAGQTSPCIVTAGAVTGVNGASAGGTGGNGGFAGNPAGGVAGPATTGGSQNDGGGGGGGGGGVGWIRIHTMTPSVGAKISPTPLVN